jgi:hypothetical protein
VEVDASGLRSDPSLTSTPRDGRVVNGELAILRRRTKRPPLTTVDRPFLAAASRLLPRTDWRAFIVTPETLSGRT